MTTGVCDQNDSKCERIEKKISGRADSIGLVFCIRDSCLYFHCTKAINHVYKFYFKWHVYYHFEVKSDLKTVLSVNRNIQLFQNIRVFIEANEWKECL